MKIRPVGAELFHADGRTDVTKIRVAFVNFANACRNHSRARNTIFFDVLLTVHLSIFISVINQLDAQNLFHNKFYFMPLHVSSTCAYHQEAVLCNFDLLMMSTCARNM